MKKLLVLQVFVACVIGLVVAWFDSRPRWDDAGISAFIVLGASFLVSVWSKQKPWLFALAVGVWIPAYGIAFSGNFGSILALLPAFMGAFIGWLMNRWSTEKI